MEYWISNADSFMHQIFMIVMGSLYALAWLLGLSYQAVNIYCYFVLFPLSFMLLLKGPKKYLFIPLYLSFFLLAGFEALSAHLFDLCVIFLKKTAAFFGSNYVEMSVFLCVLLPALMSLPVLFLKIGKEKTFLSLKGCGAAFIFYLFIIYPNFKEWLSNNFFDHDYS